MKSKHTSNGFTRYGLASAVVLLLLTLGGVPHDLAASGSPSPEPEQAPGAILQKAELEWWVKSSTEYASPRFAVVTAINKSKAAGA